MMSSSPLNFLQKIFMFFVQIFKSILKIPFNGFDDGRAVVEESKTIKFGNYDAGATVKVWYGEKNNEIDFQQALDDVEMLDLDIKDILENSTQENVVQNLKNYIDEKVSDSIVAPIDKDVTL